MEHKTLGIVEAVVKKQGRGLCLLSGGLDSQLAICVLREQGLHVEAVVFDSPFFKIVAAQRAAKQLDVRLHVVPFTHDILGLVQHPPHGFGTALNPCIDCHALMIKRAGQMMTEWGFDFVATGEVLNQRPMSQTRRSLNIVEQDAGLKGRLLRPLSALLLEPTLPEQEGIVNRTQLLGLNGRSRKPQKTLAGQYGLKEIPSSGGGCLLTERGFCRKLSDLLDHEGVECERMVGLLRYGRHLRLPDGMKCIVGRDAVENAVLEKTCQERDVLLVPLNLPGPTVFIPEGVGRVDITLASEICAAYSDHGQHTDVLISIQRGTQIEQCTVAQKSPEQFAEWKI